MNSIVENIVHNNKRKEKKLTINNKRIYVNIFILFISDFLQSMKELKNRIDSFVAILSNYKREFDEFY